MPNRWLIWAGSKLVVNAGTLMSFGEQNIDLDVWINDDLARVTFEFPADSGPTRAEYGSITGPGAGQMPPSTVYLRFYNLRGAKAFSDGPIRLGTVGGHSLWIVYEVAPAIGSDSVKKISYTLWEGPGSDQSGSRIAEGNYRG